MSFITKPYQINTAGRKYKILIYGSPGIGKTTLALSMPNPVLIDADGGVHRISPKHRVDTVQMSDYRQVLDFVQSPEVAPYETVVIDTAGRLLDYINAFIIKANGKNARGGGQLSMQGWGQRAAEFSAFMSRVNTLGKHIVFVAHDKEDKNGDFIQIRPDFGGGRSGADLMKDLDAVGYMEALNGRERTVSFSPCDRYWAKNSADLEPVITVPDVRNAQNNFLTTVLDKLVKAAEVEAVKAKEFTGLMKRIEDIKASVVDEQTLEMARAEVAGMNHIWDSEIRATRVLDELAESFEGAKLLKVLQAVTDAASANEALGELGNIQFENNKVAARKDFAAKVKKLGLVYDKASGKYSEASEAH